MKQLSFLIKPASGRCNMRCRYCFYTDTERYRESGEDRISGEAVRKLIRAADQVLDDGGEVSFAFQGGEPTLAGITFYEEFLTLCQPLRERGIRVHLSIQSNGLLMDETWAEFLSREKVLTGISVDGYGELHDRYRRDLADAGTYARVRDRVRMLLEKGVSVNLLCVVHHETAMHAREVYESLKEMGTGFVQFIPCLDPLNGERGTMPWSLTPEDYAAFLMETFELWYRDWKKGQYLSVRLFEDWVHLAMNVQPSACASCGACGSYFVVEADGRLYPCDFYAVDEYCLGRIGERSLAGLSGKKPLRTFLEKSGDKPRKCRSCRWWRLCRGGCPRDWTGRAGHYENYYCSAYEQVFARCGDRILDMAGREQALLRGI